MEIILASSSPRRKELMEKNGYEFKIIVSDIDEIFSKDLTAYENVKLMGYKKAYLIAKDHFDAITIGCDTIVVHNGIVFGKPKDSEDAFRMLSDLSGQTHQVMSGVAVFYKGDVKNFVVTSDVTFKDLSDSDIMEYIDSKECFGKAGAYAIQGIGKKLVLKFEGELDNIIGLPMIEVNNAIKEFQK